MNDQEIKAVLQEILNPLGRRLNRGTLGCFLSLLLFVGVPFVYVRFGGGNWWVDLVTGVGASFLAVTAISILVLVWQNRACKQAATLFNTRFSAGSPEREKAMAALGKMSGSIRSYGFAAAELNRLLGVRTKRDGLDGPVEEKLEESLKSHEKTPAASAAVHSPLPMTPATRFPGEQKYADQPGPASYAYIPLEPIAPEPETVKPKNETDGDSHDRNSRN